MTVTPSAKAAVAARIGVRSGGLGRGFCGGREQGDGHGGGVGGGGAVGVVGVVEPASAVAGEELRDVNYQISFSWLSCLSWLAHTICALTAFENHCND